MIYAVIILLELIKFHHIVFWCVRVFVRSVVVSFEFFLGRLWQLWASRFILGLRKLRFRV